MKACELRVGMWCRVVTARWAPLAKVAYCACVGKDRRPTVWFEAMESRLETGQLRTAWGLAVDDEVERFTEDRVLALLGPERMDEIVKSRAGGGVAKRVCGKGG